MNEHLQQVEDNIQSEQQGLDSLVVHRVVDNQVGLQVEGNQVDHQVAGSLHIRVEAGAEADALKAEQLLLPLLEPPHLPITTTTEQ